LVRHLTLDQAIAGSSPASSANDFRTARLFSMRARRWSHRLVVRTPASHVGNAGSTPAGIIQIEDFSAREWFDLGFLSFVTTFDIIVAS
jgi:hypothetical protein